MGIKRHGLALEALLMGKRESSYGILTMGTSVKLSGKVLGRRLAKSDKVLSLCCFWLGVLLLCGPPTLVYAGGDPDFPRINTNLIFDVTNTIFAGGALGNGVSNSAAAIQAAISMASTSIVANATGGTVRVSAVGTFTNYLSGPINLASHVNLLIDSGTKLQMLPKSMWTGTTTFVNGATLTDVEISGAGTIDGQYSTWGGTDPRPNFIEFDHCKRVAIQGVTLQNPPKFHIMVHNGNGNLTIQNLTINTPDGTANTDGIDLASTNVVIRNCYISDGDDNIQIGSSSAAAKNITISNCTFGTGHGLSIGSPTQDGVSNLVVANCSWNGTEYGIKGKTDRTQGGTMQDIHYSNLTMTNVNFPIAFYSHYDTLMSPSKTINVPPATAAGDTTSSITSTTPFWRNITVSNLTAVGNSGPDGPGNIAGIIWGLPESPISNMTLIGVNILGRGGNATFCAYHARGINILDSNLTAPTSGTNTLTIYNAGITITNSAPNPNVMTITGLGSPSNSVLSVFNGQAGTRDASILGANPSLTLASSTFTVSNGMTVGASSKLNFGLGTNVTKAVVTGNLTLGGTLNVADGGGFTNTTYTLFTYGGTLTYSGLTIGSTPNPGFTYTVSTNTLGQVNLIASSSCAVGAAGPISGSSSVPTGQSGVPYSISSVSGATTYTWTVPSGASIASGQGSTSIAVDYACGAVSGNITVTPSNGSCNGASNSLAVTMTAVSAAGSISGASTVCANQTGVGYSISAVNGATTYTWAVPSGASVATGQGSTSITVDWGSTGGNVTVMPANGNGCMGTGASLPVTVNLAPDVTSSPSPQTFCGVGTASLFVSATGTALTYQWRKNGSNIGNGGTISGATTTNLTLTGVTTADSGATFDCVVSGVCNPPATSGAGTLTVNPNPTAFNVTGGGASSCGTNGVAIGLDGSESGVNYQLLLNGGPSGSSEPGTGGALSFGSQTAPGTYTVAATDATTGCTNTMNGSAIVSLTDPFLCWQLQYFGCTNCPQADATADPDGYGQNNMAEYLSGTDPTNSASVLQITSAIAQGNDVVVTWTTAGGHTNMVQAATGAVDGSYTTNFTDLSAPIIILGSGDATTNYTDGGGATNVPSRFYRIRLVP